MLISKRRSFLQTLYTHHTCHMTTEPLFLFEHALRTLHVCTCFSSAQSSCSHKHTLFSLNVKFAPGLRSDGVFGGSENRILNSWMAYVNVQWCWASGQSELLILCRCHDDATDTWNVLKLKTNSTDLRPARAEGFHSTCFLYKLFFCFQPVSS